MKGQTVELILDIARQLQEGEEIEFEGELTADSALFGKEGMLDSLGLVSLVVAVEQAIEDKFEVSVALADEKALSQSSSPYRTVNTLAEYASEQVKEQQSVA